VGGATTDVYTAGPAGVHRSVSANLGLSFSVGNVCQAAGWERIARWLTVPIADEELRNAIRNKMIRPTTVPATASDLQIEQAVVREALRLALDHHVATRPDLRGLRPAEPATARLGRSAPAPRIDWRRIGLVVGSGGPLAHAPQPVQAGLMLIDGLRPRGITSLAMDEQFLFPHLGVLATVDREAARQVLFADSLVPLGVVAAPLTDRGGRDGTELFSYVLRPRDRDGGVRRGEVRRGELVALPLATGERAQLELRPSGPRDLGAGTGVEVQALVLGGPVGVLLDGRDPDLGWPRPRLSWREDLKRWQAAVGVEREVDA
jgi:hypothetical protein